MKERGRIVNRGAGGFLCPPTHPMHTWSVETDLHRKPDDRGSMSLEYAVDCPYLDDATRAAAQAVLDAWQPPPLAEVQDWIYQVLGYFVNCYNDQPRNETGWHASNLTIESRNPMAHLDHHAGVHLIRRYYPQYQPTESDFSGAYWGTRT